MGKNINRLKAVLADKKRTNRWLAAQLDKDEATVSKWCTNAAQPPLETFVRIAKLLDVDMNELIRFDEIPKPEIKLIGKEHGEVEGQSQN